MRFSIQDGMPYLISGGRAFPVEITEKKEVIIANDNSSMTDEVGYLTLQEVIAKIGYTKKDEPPQEESQEPNNDDNAENFENGEENPEIPLSGEDKPPQEEKKGRKKSNLS